MVSFKLSPDILTGEMCPGPESSVPPLKMSVTEMAAKTVNRMSKAQTVALRCFWVSFSQAFLNQSQSFALVLDIPFFVGDLPVPG